MAVRCPNKNSNEWKRLVSAIGEDNAYKVFVHNNEFVPEIDEVEDYIDKFFEQRQIKDSDTNYQLKVTKLQSAFKKHNISVKVTNEESGNFIEPDGKGKVRINIDPRKRFGDSVFHEFGHLYVDILGFNDPLVQRGIEQLKDTMLWDLTKQINPTLSDRLLAKEVLTTAIGIEASDIFRNETKISKWKYWLNRLFRKIAEFLGIQQNVAKDLATDLIRGDLRGKLDGEIEKVRQWQEDADWIKVQNKLYNYIIEKKITYDKEIAAYRSDVSKRKFTDLVKETIETSRLENAIKCKDLLDIYHALVTTAIFDRKMLTQIEQKLDKYRKKYKDADIDILDEETRKLSEVVNQSVLFTSTYRAINDLEYIETNDKDLNDLQKRINDFIKRMRGVDGPAGSKSIPTRIQDLENHTKEMILKFYHGVMQLSSDEKTRNEAYKLLKEGFNDETFMQYRFDALFDSNHPIPSNLIKFTRLYEGRAKEESDTIKKQFYSELKAFQNAGGTIYNIIDEKIRLIQEFLIDEFHESRANLYQELNRLDPASYEYAKKKNAWYRTNTSQKYTEDFYQYEDALSDEAKREIHYIRKERGDILSKYNRDKKGNKRPFDARKISVKDRVRLREIERYKKYLSNSQNFPEGSKDAEVAIELQEFWYNKPERLFDEIAFMSLEGFQKMIDTYKESLDEKEFNAYMQRNTRPTSEFYNKLTSVLSILRGNKSKAKEDLQIDELLEGYKDEMGNVIGTEVPQDVREEVAEIERQKHIDKESKEFKDFINNGGDIKDFKLLRNYDDSGLSKAKKRALKDFKELVEFVPTEYYYKEYSKQFNLAKSKRKGKKLTETQFKQTTWYKENHRPNYYTGEVEPISIWTTMRPKTDKVEGMLVRRTDGQLAHEFTGLLRPSPQYYKYEVASEFINPFYREDEGGNPFPSHIWNNPAYVNMKPEFKKFRDFLNNTLTKAVDHYDGTLIDKGFLPSIPTEKAYKELGKREKELENVQIFDVNGDRVFILPLKYVGRLGAEPLIHYRFKRNDETYEEYEKDVLEELEREGKSFNSIEEVIAENKRIKDKNAQVHADSVNLNIEKTIPLFLEKAYEHKYKKQIEQDVLLALAGFKHTNVLRTDGQGRAIIDKYRQKNLEGVIEHITNPENWLNVPSPKAIDDSTESNVYKHLKKDIEMKFYDEFTLDQGTVTDIGKKLKNYVSLKGIGFNPFSGFKNVTYGKIQTAVEAGGGYYFDYSDFSKAEADWWRGWTSYLSDTQLDNSASSTIENALIKKFDVIQSQSELNDLEEGKAISRRKAQKIFMSAAYFMQEAGEHYMQNQTLFAMMRSHRLVDGKIMSFVDYRDIHVRKPSIDEVKEYARYMDEYKSHVKNAKKDFEKYPSVRDLYYLKDGYAEVKPEYAGKVSTDDITLFVERVKGVNHKIHGIYNKADKGTIENTIWGQLLMQFRHWARPGWNKRFGSRWGEKFWNERRREVDSGSYADTWRFLTTPVRKNNKDNWSSEEERNVTNVAKAIIDSYSEFASNIKYYWFDLSDTEKSNVMRTAHEMAVLALMIGLFNMLRLAGEDDEDLKSRDYYNFLIYQADALILELSAYTPVYGWFNEGSKILANPMATWGTIQGVAKLLRAAYMYPVNGVLGTPEKNYFRGGRYHKELKVKVYTERLIPLWNQIERWMNIEKNNRYYKLF